MWIRNGNMVGDPINSINIQIYAVSGRKRCVGGLSRQEVCISGRQNKNP